MSYYLSHLVALNFDDAIAKVTAALAQEGFGVLTDIDVQATLKKKIDADMPRYRILGACNPQLAAQALQAESKLGVMLPCNVIVRDAGDQVEIASVDPIDAMARIGNPKLIQIASTVREKLQRAIDSV